MTELLFIVEEHENGLCNAKAVGADIAAQAMTREGVENSVRRAVRERFPVEDELPQVIHLHFVCDKTIPMLDASVSEKGDIVHQLRGSVLKDDDPFGPATPLEDWESLR